MPKLTESQIVARLATTPEWERHGDMLVRSWRFASAQRAVEFFNRVAELARTRDRYPDVEWRFRDVRIELATHSEGGLTEADFEFAEALGKLPAE
jgi:4a-hydroxytetrahydrobiopterin dehydratase